MTTKIESKIIEMVLPLEEEAALKLKKYPDSKITAKSIETYIRKDASLKELSEQGNIALCTVMKDSDTADRLALLTINPKDVLAVGKIKNINQNEVTFEFKVVDPNAADELAGTPVALDRVVGRVVDGKYSIAFATFVPRAAE